MSNWILTRDDNAETLSFPEDLQWFDEFEWSSKAQSTPQYTIGGSWTYQEGIKLAGRPITIGGDEQWLTRGDFLQLMAWNDVISLGMTLTAYDGRVFNVAFRTSETAIDCKPVSYRTPETDTDPYTGKIKLMVIK